MAIVLFALISTVVSDHGHGHGGHGHGHGYGHHPAHYNYGYKVHDDYHKTNFGHTEHRDGYNTKGEYYVHLPDGRIQTVTYHVGDGYSGYVADVKYSGKPHYAPHKPHGKPHHGYH